MHLIGFQIWKKKFGVFGKSSLYPSVPSEPNDLRLVMALSSLSPPHFLSPPKNEQNARCPIRWNTLRFDSDKMSPLYENCCLTVDLVQMLMVRTEECCRRAQVGPVGDKIGSPRPPLSKGEPRVSLTRAHAAQGGVTLGLEQGELRANFCILATCSSHPNMQQKVVLLNLDTSTTTPSNLVKLCM
jgi:hypothetical protein